MKNVTIPVKYQESRIGCENLAYFQSIENKCKLNIMTKIYLGKRQTGSIKLALLPCLQIYHDNKKIEGNLQTLRWMYILSLLWPP